MLTILYPKDFGLMKKSIIITVLNFKSFLLYSSTISKIVGDYNESMTV